jgi:hypothetical protein
MYIKELETHRNASPAGRQYAVLREGAGRFGEGMAHRSHMGLKLRYDDENAFCGLKK